jgi:hypothetical protein
LFFNLPALEIFTKYRDNEKKLREVLHAWLDENEINFDDAMSSEILKEFSIKDAKLDWFQEAVRNLSGNFNREAVKKIM